MCIFARGRGRFDLLGKRGLGFINWQRGRKYIHRPELLDAIVRDLKDLAVDHIAVTGDLVNLSLPAEYRARRAWLETAWAAGRRHGHSRQPRHLCAAGAALAGGVLGRLHAGRRRRRARHVSVSAPARARRADRAFDGGADRRRSWRPAGSAIASFAAWRDALDETRGLFRVVLIHHPPVSRRPAAIMRRLIDARGVLRVLRKTAPNCVLHGHDHRRAIIWLDGPAETIPVVGVPSASARVPHGHEDAAGYNVFRIDGELARGAARWCAPARRRRAVREIERQKLA